MDKTTLKIVGARLRREFATLEELPFPLQQALAELARRETETFAGTRCDGPACTQPSEVGQRQPSNRQ